MKRISFAAALLTAGTLAMAQSTPAGLWKTIDDETKAERSQVRISEAGGVFTGKIVKIIDATKQDAKCDKCEGARKDAPIVGLTIIEDVKKVTDGDDFEGGTILDPNNGKAYKVRMAMQDGGKTLRVRGYIGPIYRSQFWVRVE